jgi:hypothetical protein
VIAAAAKGRDEELSNREGGSRRSADWIVPRAEGIVEEGEEW